MPIQTPPFGSEICLDSETGPTVPLPIHTSWHRRDRWWLAHLSDRKSAATLLVGNPWGAYPCGIRLYTHIPAHQQLRARLRCVWWVGVLPPHVIHVLCQSMIRQQNSTLLPDSRACKSNQTISRFFIVLSYAWGWLLSGERPDKGDRLHASVLKATCMINVCCS